MDILSIIKQSTDFYHNFNDLSPAYMSYSHNFDLAIGEKCQVIKSKIVASLWVQCKGWVMMTE